VCQPWSGNCVLSGTRIVNSGQADDDIALAFNEFVPDTNTLGLWHLNEAQWTGATHEIIDSSGNGHHGQIYNFAYGHVTQGEWLDRCAEYDNPDPNSSENGWIYIHENDAVGLDGLAKFTIEAWLRPEFDVTNTYVPNHRRAIVKGQTGSWGCWPGSYLISFVEDKIWIECVDTDRHSHLLTVPAADWVSQGVWFHLALVHDGSELALFINGQLANSIDFPYAMVSNPDNPLHFGQGWTSAAAPVYCWTGGIDEVRISDTPRYLSNFSPHRYEAGVVVAQYALDRAYTLTQIDWSGTFGASYGQVRAVYVYSSGQWVQVGGDYPTPPLTGLSLQVSGPDLVKVELEPKQDALHSETPILDWLSVALEPITEPVGRRRISASAERRVLYAGRYEQMPRGIRLTRGASEP